MFRKVIASVAALTLLLSAGACAETGTSFRMAGYESTSSHDWNNNRALERVEEKTGVKVEYQQYTEESEWTKAKAEMTADSTDLPDAFFKAALTSAEQQSLYEKGVLIDLKPMLETYAPNLWALLQEDPARMKAIELPDGAIVALPTINPLQNNNAMWINTQWLSRVGLSMPTTADELTEVLRAFRTQDPNQNGRADEVPLTFTGMWDLRWLAHAFGITSNDYYVTLENGTVRETLTSDQNRAFLEWLHQLYEERLIDRDGLSSAQSTRQITDTSATITYGIVFGPSIMSMLPSSEMDHYEVLMPLTCNGTQTYRRLLYDTVGGAFAITSRCSDPKALLQWVDHFYTEEYCYLTQAGLQDQEYEVYSDGTWHWLDTATVITNTILPEYTLSGGTLMPGYTPLTYQTLFDDAQTRKAVSMLVQLDSYAVYPYPMVQLTADEQSRVSEIWAKLGTYCETQMARFVTGDIKLDDASWAEFCQQAEALGLSSMVSLWQSILE